MSFIAEIPDEKQKLTILAYISTHLLVPWMTIILMYSIFIPNTWQRCAAHVVPAACVPILVYIAGAARIPGAWDFVLGEVMLEMVLWATVPTLAAIFGAHTLNTLRRKAAMARELGSYQLKQSLGAGGMGEVYLGEHKLLKRPCAVKLIRGSKATDPQAIARFEREVQATAKLTHWNTIEIFDYGHTEDGTFYYVMEYLPGMSLQDLVDRFGPMPPSALFIFFAKFAMGCAKPIRWDSFIATSSPATSSPPIAERSGMSPNSSISDSSSPLPPAHRPANHPTVWSSEHPCSRHPNGPFAMAGSTNEATFIPSVPSATSSSPAGPSSHISHPSSFSSLTPMSRSHRCEISSRAFPMMLRRSC